MSFDMSWQGLPVLLHLSLYSGDSQTVYLHCSLARERMFICIPFLFLRKWRQVNVWKAIWPQIRIEYPALIWRNSAVLAATAFQSRENKVDMLDQNFYFLASLWNSENIQGVTRKSLHNRRRWMLMKQSKPNTFSLRIRDLVTINHHSILQGSWVTGLHCSPICLLAYRCDVAQVRSWEMRPCFSLHCYWIGLNPRRST